MEILTNTGAFIVVLGVMIFFHEFGHFITAKAFGMRVFIFSFGFGRRLMGFRWGDTDCRISLVPLGGYVKLEGEPDDPLSEASAERGDGRDFTSRPRWQRILVYLAGPFMNVVLTVGVLTGLYMIGFQVEASRYDAPVIGVVEPGSPAEAAGLRPGDHLVSLDGVALENWEAAQYNILIRPDDRFPVEVERGARRLTLEVASTAKDAERVGAIGVHPLVRIGEVVAGAPAEAAGLKADDAILRIDGEVIRSFDDIPPLVAKAEGRPLELEVFRDGRSFDVAVTPRDEGRGPLIGIGRKTVEMQFGFARAALEALRWTWNMTTQTFEILQRLVTARLSTRTMMGPIGIAQASGDAARAGAGSLAFLVAVISLQIGILNLFPLPPLDGGHLAILIGESVLRRDFSLNAKIWVMNAGAAALFLLIGLVLYSDLSKTSLFGRFLP
jgi:regulator of sigma E protease